MRSLNTFLRWHFYGRILARLLAVFAAAGICIPETATGRSKPLSKYLREEWGSEKGFPGGTINVITQTLDGYLWLGTQKGLVRFDGLNFRMFSQTTGGSPMGPVLGLLADGEGNLWVRLVGPGLLRYRDGKFDDYSDRFDITEIAVTSMFRAADSRAMFVTILNGIVAYEHGKFNSVAGAPHLPSFLVTSTAPGPGGTYWLGTRDRGLFHLSDGKISAAREVLTERKINVLLSAGDKQLWIGTDNGLLLKNGAELVHVGSGSSLRARQILSLSRDGHGSIWVGTDHGMYRLDPESNFLPKVDNTEGDGPVTSIFEDREGNIWTATPRSLQRLRNTVFTTYGVSDGLPRESNGPLHPDSDGRIWFAPIQGGLYWLKEGAVESFREAGLDKDVVYSIAGGNGDLWVARQLGGLTHLQDIAGKWQAVTYTKADGLGQNSVYTVRLSRDGAVWAGTLSAGLTRIKNGKFVTFTSENGLISNTIASILESRDGTMWFSTPRGLSAFSNNHWLSFSNRDGLPSDDINCLFEDSRGTLWIGTMNGLAAFRSGKIWVPEQVSDFLREPVFGLQEDSNGLMWISTSNHVLMTSLQRLLESDFHDADVREFGLADGLSDTNAVKRDEAVVSDNSGRVWFSLNRGLSVVDTNRLRASSPPSILHLEGLSVDGNVITLQEPNFISPNPQRITINYAGISLSTPDRVRFKSKLDGFDPSWSDPRMAREASYTNLGPGSYVFRVIACNSDGLWNSTELTVPFTIKPVFWRTWWFGITALFAFVLSFLGIVRLRVLSLTRQFNMRLEERVSERTRIARDLHDTLLQSFHGVLLHLQAVSNVLPSGEPKQKLDNTIDQAAQAITEGRDAVQGLRASTVVTNDLARAISTLGEELATNESKPNAAEFHVEVEGTSRDLHPVLRDEVYRIAGEALRNAFRHAEARRIEVDFRYHEREFRLRIRDDGKGIDPKLLSEGGRPGHYGLRGMHERAKLMGGKLIVWSELDAGTEVELKIPGSRAYETFSSRSRSWLAEKLSGKEKEMKS